MYLYLSKILNTPIILCKLLYLYTIKLVKKIYLHDRNFIDNAISLYDNIFIIVLDSILDIPYTVLNTRDILSMNKIDSADDINRLK